ncbi:MAG: hypothetical protein Ct9H300mP8_01160 [Gammaproteobacteria bacterium]|nr:MAG: hypothetical protein Ct9H300mP8_01160 [Gammaproteobacteria bacterium]
MQHYAGLDRAPFFMPTVGNFYRGMLVQTPFFLDELDRSVRPADFVEIFQNRYADEPFVRALATPFDDELEKAFFRPPHVTAVTVSTSWCLDMSNRSSLSLDWITLGKVQLELLSKTL